MLERLCFQRAAPVLGMLRYLQQSGKMSIQDVCSQTILGFLYHSDLLTRWALDIKVKIRQIIIQLVIISTLVYG